MQCIQCLRSKDQIWRAHNTLQPTMWHCDIIESKSINTTKQETRPVSVSRHQTVAENCWNIAIACLCCSCSSMLPTACPIDTEYSWWFPINFLMEVSATQFWTKRTINDQILTLYTHICKEEMKWWMAIFLITFCTLQTFARHSSYQIQELLRIKTWTLTRNYNAQS